MILSPGPPAREVYSAPDLQLDLGHFPAERDKKRDERERKGRLGTGMEDVKNWFQKG